MVPQAVFLDRDGTINADTDYVHRAEDFRFLPGALEGAALLARAGSRLVVVTNQSGIGRGYYGVRDFEALTGWMRERFLQAGAPIAGVYYCPHHPIDALPPWRCACQCRKPAPGMILAACKDLGLDPRSCAIVGDSPRDTECGLRAGVPVRILVGKDGLATPKPVPSATHTARDLLEAARILVEGAP